MYGGPDPYRRPPPPMDPYARGGYGGYAGYGGMMCGDMSGYLLPGTVIISLFLGLILLTTGFAAPNWLEGTNANMGLWRSCTKVGTTETCVNLVGDNNPDIDWLTATQALTTIALIFMLLGLALLIYFLCSYSRYFFVKALVVSLLFMTFVFLVVAIGIYGGNHDDKYPTMDLDWSFYLVCVASVMVLISVVFLLCIESNGSFPSFGGPRPGPYGRRGMGGMGMGGMGGMGGFRGPPPPRPDYGGSPYGNNPYGSGTLPFTSRY